MEMTLEEYKKKVADYLRYLGETEERIEYLMRECEEDIQTAYKENWEISAIATPMYMNLI